MKHCTNPACHSTFLFNDEQTHCPYCHQPLVSTAGSTVDQPLNPPDADLAIPQAPHQPPFLQQRFGATVVCTGRVVEIDHQALFYGRMQKLFNTLFRGEPYQFGHQTVEYVIRVEPITDGIPTEVMDFSLFGNFLGRLQVGDEVHIKAKDCHHRRIVKSIYNQTTDTMVKPGVQLSAAALRTVLLLLLLLATTAIWQFVRLVQSGILLAMLLSLAAHLLDALAPIILALVGIYILIRCIFPGNRR